MKNINRKDWNPGLKMMVCNHRHDLMTQTYGHLFLHHDMKNINNIELRYPV